MTKKERIVLTERDRALNHVRVALVASVAALVIGLAGVALIFGEVTGSLERNLAHANADRAQVKIDLHAQQDALSEANKRLIEAGEKPVTPPVPGPQGLPGANGRPPTAGEIRDAVASYCAAVNECRGPAGQSVTRGQVAAAVSSYCDSRGECRGPVGITGRTGTNGTDGSDGATGATGQQGPPPSDAQVLAAVSAFCADGRCRGEVGPQGPPGADGAPGPACPPGFTPEQRVVITDGGPQPAVLCVAD